MIIVNKTPKEFTLTRQTIPFLVISDLFDTQSFDVIERSFKYLFEIKTLRDDGTYRTFSNVAIPPRPDNLTGLFDASKIVQSAIDFDNGTHKINVASSMERSIVQFKVICSERYLDTNGNYITGDIKDLGTYYAIDGGVIEGLDDYLITGSTPTKLAMHHHELLDKDFEIKPGEPLTVSFLTKPSISPNKLQFIHGDYGSFDNGTITQYSGITKGTPVVSLVKGTSGLSGSSLKAIINNSGFNFSSTSGELIRFNTLGLQSGTTYEFTIYGKLSGSISNAPTSGATLNPNVVGTGIDTIVSTISPSIRQTVGSYQEIKIVFTTNSTIGGTEYINITATSPTTNNLIRLNSRNFEFDSAILKEINSTLNPINKARIVVNKGTTTEKIHVLTSSYLNNVLPFTEIKDGRFDCPVGLNNIYEFEVTGSTQNELNQFLDLNGNVGIFYNLELYNSGDTGTVIATSNNIYQVGECGRYNSVRLKWLNDLGGWDYYTFDKVSVATTRVDKEVYKISSGRITGNADDGFDYVENDIDRGYKTLMVLSDDYLIINSDWVINEVGKFLRGILTSREVYILNPEPFMELPITQEYDLEYPVIIEDTEFEYRNNSSEGKLTNATFRIKIAVPFNSRTTNV